jgi:hypothetical protein
MPPWPDDKGDSPIDAMHRFQMFFLALMMFVYLAVAVMEFFAAWALRHQRWYWFCFVMSIMNCLGPPVGVVLGVFTIIVLLRPQAKQLFGVALVDENVGEAPPGAAASPT